MSETNASGTNEKSNVGAAILWIASAVGVLALSIVTAIGIWNPTNAFSPGEGQLYGYLAIANGIIAATQLCRQVSIAGPNRTQAEQKRFVRNIISASLLVYNLAPTSFTAAAAQGMWSSLVAPFLGFVLLGFELAILIYAFRPVKN